MVITVWFFGNNDDQCLGFRNNGAHDLVFGNKDDQWLVSRNNHDQCLFIRNTGPCNCTWFRLYPGDVWNETHSLKSYNQQLWCELECGIKCRTVPNVWPKSWLDLLVGSFFVAKLATLIILHFCSLRISPAPGQNRARAALHLSFKR